MPVYVVSCELNRPGHKYPELREALRGLNCKELLLSQWAVHAKGPADALRDYLLQYMDSTDRMLVIERDGPDWAAVNLLNGIGSF